MEAAELSRLARHSEVRFFDWMLLVILLGFFSVIPFINNILYFGDWDFWADWKDKLYWPIVAPALALLVFSAVSYIAWELFRLPIGCTFAAVATMSIAWVSRIGSWHALESYPLNFIFPSTFIPMAILVDVMLMYTGSRFFTGLFGGFLWGLTFYAVNWLVLMPYLQPVVYQGQTFTVADLMGYYFVRPQTPEYLRRVDQGSLTAFFSERIWITVFNAGVICPIAYWAGQLIGWAFATWPVGRLVKRL